MVELSISTATLPETSSAPAVAGDELPEIVELTIFADITPAGPCKIGSVVEEGPASAPRQIGCRRVHEGIVGNFRTHDVQRLGMRMDAAAAIDLRADRGNRHYHLVVDDPGVGDRNVGNDCRNVMAPPNPLRVVGSAWFPLKTLPEMLTVTGDVCRRHLSKTANAPPEVAGGAGPIGCALLFSNWELVIVNAARRIATG